MPSARRWPRNWPAVRRRAPLRSPPTRRPAHRLGPRPGASVQRGALHRLRPALRPRAGPRGPGGQPRTHLLRQPGGPVLRLPRAEDRARPRGRPTRTQPTNQIVAPLPPRDSASLRRRAAARSGPALTPSVGARSAAAGLERVGLGRPAVVGAEVGSHPTDPNAVQWRRCQPIPGAALAVHVDERTLIVSSSGRHGRSACSPDRGTEGDAMSGRGNATTGRAGAGRRIETTAPRRAGSSRS